MKLTDLLTQAQMLSGLGSFEGNAIDQNLMATSLAVFHQTLNFINNDPKTTLWQEKWDYQRDNDSEIVFEDETSAMQSEKFPDYIIDNNLPFNISLSYPLPADCRRVIKAVSRQSELRKTDFSEIASARRRNSLGNMYAVNNRRIELVNPDPIEIIYAKEFPEFMPKDEVIIPHESLDYVINLTAYNLALSFNMSSAERCRILADKSYNALVGNLIVNTGDKYINTKMAINRLT